jgi:hypothetical protein
MAQDQQAILSCQEDSESCEAGDWFSGADRSAGLIEEVVGLGKFGRTLTILTLDPDIADGDEEADEGEQWEPPRFR